MLYESIIKEAGKDPVLAKWLDYNVNLAIKSKVTYIYMLKGFCRWLNVTPSQLLNPENALNFTAHVKRYIAYLKEQNRAPKGMYVAIAALKSFCECFNISLKLKKRDKPKGDAVNIHEAPSKETLKLLIARASPKLRALMLVMKDCGLRVSDVVRVTPANITFEPDGFATIRTLTKKAGVRCVTFIGPEATEGLKPYIATVKPNEPIFNIAPGSVARLINRLCRKVDVKTTPHCLRVYFQTQMEQAGVPWNWIKLMMGHKNNAVERAYSRPSVEMLKETYKRSYHALALSTIIRPKAISKEEVIEMLRDILNAAKVTTLEELRLFLSK